MRQADDGGRIVKGFLAFMMAACAFGAVDGTVMNQSTGKPQPGATVTLYKLGQSGMESLESVKAEAAGKFTINQNIAGPHLIQAAWDGVTYNHMLPPGQPTNGVTVEVFNSTRSAGVAQLTTHMILLEPDGTNLSVNESLIFKNEGTTSYNNPEGGTLRLFLPEAARGKVRVNCTAPKGMPIERAAEKTSVEGVYKVDFPIKPGETRFDLTYTLPLADGGSFSGKVVQAGGVTRVVAPQGVTLESPVLELLGQEPNTQASVYELKNKSYAIVVKGAGALRAPEAGGQDEEETGQGIQKVKPFLYDRFYPVLGLALLIMALGFLLLYRKAAPEAAAPEAAPAPPRKGKRK
ncbi:MAG: hypothetical protein JJE04_21025 [Acidobacteriia bacterium]|nr:hypothetical protein [Terriglobia bacterium]